jgi:magnesium-transporting ATPase (P-type)
MVTSRGWFVQVKMITGDHKTIAIETARVLGMGTLIQGPQGLPVRSCSVDEYRTGYIPNALRIGVHFDQISERKLARMNYSRQFFYLSRELETWNSWATRRDVSLLNR